MKKRNNKLSKGVITLICTLLVFSAAIIPATVYAVSTQPAETVTVVPAPAPADGAAAEFLPDAATDSAPAADLASEIVSGSLSAPTPADENAAQPTEIEAPTPSEEGCEDEIVWIVEEVPQFDSVAPSIKDALAGVDMDALRDVLYDGLIECTESINIQEFGIDLDDRGFVMSFMLYSMPECFHLGQSFGFSYNPTTNALISVKPAYLYTTPEAYQAELARCQASAAKILSGIAGNDELTDVEKALLIHDRLAILCEYDTRVQKNDPNDPVPTKSHRMNGALVDGLAVCEGYALAYGYLLDQVGIENYYVSSDKMNHAWNIVYIDGKPYHVDVTWDDPTGDILGRVKHDNFLRSSAGLYETGHYQNGTYVVDYDTTPTDTTYDNAYWQNSQTAFQYLNGSLYYIDSSAQYLCQRVGNTTTRIFSVSDSWKATSGGTWPANYARLACDGVNLLYTKTTGVYEYNPISGSNKLIWSPSLPSTYQIYGFVYRDGQMICELFNTPNIYWNTTGVSEVKQTRTISRIPGDADGDGTVAPMDALLLQQYLNGLDVEIKTALCDVDGDGQITMRDLIMIRQYANAIKVTLK